MNGQKRTSHLLYRTYDNLNELATCNHRKEQSGDKVNLYEKFIHGGLFKVKKDVQTRLVELIDVDQDQWTIYFSESNFKSSQQGID